MLQLDLLSLSPDVALNKECVNVLQRCISSIKLFTDCCCVAKESDPRFDQVCCMSDDNFNWRYFFRAVRKFSASIFCNR